MGDATTKTPFAKPDDINSAWRPLKSAEVTKAQWWCEVASRRIRRRWPDVDTRIQAGRLEELDVRDVVIALVVEVLGGPPVAGARSYSVTAGAESRSITLDRGGPFDPNLFTAWMVEVFEGARATTTHPEHSFPARDEAKFGWMETA